MTVRNPKVVRVVRPPENCTDHQKTQEGVGFSSGWSVGPTQIRYCGSVEKKERRLDSLYNVTIPGLGRTSGPPTVSPRAVRRFEVVRAVTRWSDHPDQSQPSYISEVTA